MNDDKLWRRVLRVSAWNGASVTLLGVLGIPLALLMKDATGAIVALAVTASGAMELAGRSKAKARSEDAGRWLQGSQLFLFATIACYCAYQMWSFDPAQLGLVSGMQDALGENLGVDPSMLDQELRTFSSGFYIAVAALAFFYQGGMWWFYRRSMAKLNTAPVDALR